MTEEHTSLKVDSSVVQDGHSYKDVDTYVLNKDQLESIEEALKNG